MLPARGRRERPIRKALDEDAPERIACHFGARTPSRAQSEELSQDQRAPEFIDEVKRRGTGLCVLLQEGSTPAEAGFWGYSGG
jgi:hypothetical protein